MGRKVRHLLCHTLRAACLLGTLLALALVLLAQLRPSWLAAVDQALEDARFAGPHAELYQAALLTDRDPAAGIPRLGALAARYAGFHPGDRQHAIHAVATSLQARALLAAQQADQALQIIDQQLVQRTRDLGLRLLRLDALRATPAGERELAGALAELHALLPEHPGIAAQLVEWHCQREEWLPAARALARHLQAPRAAAFMLRHDAPAPTDANLRRVRLLPLVAADGRIVAHFRLPEGATTAWIDLPDRSWVNVAGAELRLEGATTAMTPEPVGRSALRVQLPAPAPQDGIACTFTARVHALLPPHLRPWLRGPAADRMLAALVDAGLPHEAAELQRHRTWQVLADGISVRWRPAPGAPLTGPIAAVPAFGLPGADGVGFAVEWSLDALCSELHFDPWPSADLPFVIRMIRLDEAGTTIELGPGRALGTAATDAGSAPALVLPRAMAVTALRLLGTCP